MLLGFGFFFDVVFYIFSLKHNYFEFIVFCLYDLVMKDGLIEMNFTMKNNFT